MTDFDPFADQGGRASRRERAAQAPEDDHPGWMDQAWDTTTPDQAPEPRWSQAEDEFDPFHLPQEHAPEPEPVAVPEAPQPKASKAGRNLPAAIGVGVGLGSLVVASLFVQREGALFLLAAAVLIGIWELVRALGEGPRRPPFTPLAAGGVLMIGLAWYGGLPALVIGLLLTIFAAAVWRIADGPPGYQRATTSAALVAAYVPFLGSFFVLLLRPEDGALRVVAVVAAVVLSDTGGYIAGVLFGKHPMAPTVSPKKSWEGFGGSVLACAVGGSLMLYFMLDAPWWSGIIFGVLLAAGSTLGDLAESLLKRDLGIKDMGTLLPGHGGVMDRLDSLLVAAPLGYMLLSVFAAPTV
ncbi:phosphatidate cytidylyltransferase [Longispora albida]|uniref:phosphatidate cytidylyltransferase n=1 Tax=Longispora albida TaxID=203523 RepID=UPI0003A235FA|nr:phosphatidate cytidylyltransferase [Longispora albida]